MLDLPGQPVLDKQALIGGCLRLPLRVDASRLRTEVAALPEASWGSTGGRVGVHSEVRALFLRGYAPAEGAKPIEDRELLASLPYVQVIIRERIPAPPLRCLLARMPAGVTIAPHIDRAPYFAKTVRLHVPVETHDEAWMVAGELCYLMAPGEVWALNNSAPHAVWNAHPTRSRTHLICDFLPSTALLDMLSAGQRDLGRRVEAVDRHFASAPAKSASATFGQ